MKVLIDGMGGDYAPDEIVKGAVKAAPEIKETIVIIGPEELIRKALDDNKWKGGNIEIVDATEVITNDESPAMAVKKKKDSTIVKGMGMIRSGEADVFISGGSTGALLSAGLINLGRIKGIKRPSIAAWFPRCGREGSTLLLDCGANVESKPEYIYQSGIMGSIFVKGITGNDEPVVRLLNVGAEEGKGDDLHKDAFKMLEKSDINFKGNVEARDVVFGETDVVVTDGFSGNVFLKSSEGMSLAITGLLRQKLTESLVAKAGAALVHSKLKALKTTFGYADAGGAPILGLKGAVLKIHGNSKETEVYYAIHRAIDYVSNDINGMIEEAILKNEAIKKEQSISGRIAEAISTASETFRKKPDAEKARDEEDDPFAVFMQVDGKEQQEEK
ncbi:MAG: phosphate acyltransferase PlsX [Mogibacterium sp.]|nr:phosphate acyltransferase PlsX [Mogibacterium sp.]